MKWPEGFINQIICGDCLEVMKGISNNSIDTIITDPPYGIGFMGKEWDTFKSNFVRKSVEKSNRNTVKKDGMASKSGIRYDESLSGHQNIKDWCVKWMKECLRIAKPGATFLCCGSPRVYHHIALATERAGWILKDCIIWLYGSGFPKATDISKQIDKSVGKEREVVGVKEGTYADIHRDKKTGIAELHGGIAREKDRIKCNITAPVTPEATLWNGWKSHGLKPAYEPIIVAMKPNEGSYANNALKWGVAGLNIDGGRISFKDKQDEYHRNNKTASKGIFFKEQKDYELNRNSDNKGRYPANVILDEEAGRLLDEQSGNTSVTGKRKDPLKGYHQPEGGEWFGRKNHNGTEYQDKGGASRFFYCAKAGKSERNRGCEELENVKFTAGNYSQSPVCKDCGKTLNGTNDHSNCSGEIEYREMKSKKTGNNHPTVKPLALMKYLCRLTKTPTGGIALDPFCGSGTTLMACKELKRDYIGIDNNPEYCEIARKRVNSIPESLF